MPAKVYFLSSKAGVCDGRCGLFVQGTYKNNKGEKTDCTADWQTMVDSYQTILGNGCQTCGWVDITPSKISSLVCSF